MARKLVSKVTETNVLLQSRRRCCICFGLDRDTRLKSGQIAHLDKNNSNDAEENLAFLCFDHHDEYDSRSSQRKNFTISEVKEFRSELYRTIGKGFTQPVHFGEITTSPSDPYAGAWIRVGDPTCSAELTLTPLPDSWEGSVQYFVMGLAIWGGERLNGPNLGTIEFVGTMNDQRRINYERMGANNRTATTALAFSSDGFLEITEDVGLGEYGWNVTFTGIYQRAP